jgi:hypothetical protein
MREKKKQTMRWKTKKKQSKRPFPSSFFIFFSPLSPSSTILFSIPNGERKEGVCQRISKKRQTGKSERENWGREGFFLFRFVCLRRQKKTREK